MTPVIASERERTNSFNEWNSSEGTRVSYSEALLHNLLEKEPKCPELNTTGSPELKIGPSVAASAKSFLNSTITCYATSA